MTVTVGAVVAALILVTSFPLSVLLGQHRQLSAEAAQLSQLKHQNSQLAEQHLRLTSNAEVKRLAQQNYQLVAPGKSLFLILPPAGRSATLTPGAATAGDPANQPLVGPSQAPNMSPDPGLPDAGTPAPAGATAPAAHGSSGQAPSSYWSRIARSLEFWR